MSTAPRRKPAPLRVTTSGLPARGDLRALAALLVKLDQAPPLRLVSDAQAPPPQSTEAQSP